MTKRWTSTVSCVSPKRLASKRERAAFIAELKRETIEYIEAVKREFPGLIVERNDRDD